MKSLAKLLIIGTLLASVNCGKKSTPDDASGGSAAGGGGGGGGGGAPCVGKLMFATSVPNGNFGGASGGDTICNGNKPSGFSSSSFKAFVGDVGARAACYSAGNDDCSSSTAGRVDWPLASNTTYCSLATETVGTTTANALMNATGYVDSANAHKYFTGFNIYFGISTSNNCTDYSTTGGAASTAGLTNGGFGVSQSLSCASAGYILCVEQ